ncbi:MAG: vitamin B12-dependent ribonucleotide reductase, partial [Patescibacteria group bacterium]
MKKIVTPVKKVAAPILKLKTGSRSSGDYTHNANSKISLVKRFFTRAATHPFDEVIWEKRTIKISGPQGTLVDAKGLEFPKFWSQNSASITGAKYFRGSGDKRETSVKQMISRVVKTIAGWGEATGYFNTKNEAKIFEDELTHLLLYQKAAFNSPVWFNVGIKEKPQCSACFILKVDDNMESIMDWIHTEAMIFKGGSGAGINISNLRSSKEPLSNGGYSSGPVSFMRGADSVAGMIKSGGATRRAAKMVLLNIDHPDVMEFIRIKAEEEKKVRAFMAAGYNMQSLNDPAWNSIQYQNANNSVRLSDEFLKAVEDDKDWQTKFITTGQVADTYKARELMKEISQAAWECADPGVHYKTTIDKWHTCPNTGPITGCNPCSEYMHLDNSACNLASINLIHFLNKDGSFRTKDFIQAVDVLILAQEIIVGQSSYPTVSIEKTAHDYRQLGLGFANLGGLLMAKALPYDSDEARAWAGAITSLMSGEAYKISALVASKIGAYAGYKINKEPQLKVISMHRDKVKEINPKVLDDKKLYEAAAKVWNEALVEAKKHGVRNSQVTVIAPTGTIALMMDCACTGIEPLFAPFIYKQLVGGGYMKFVADTIPLALEKLNYSAKQIKVIMAWIEEKGAIEGAPDLKAEHLAVFDCAVKPSSGTRAIHWQGHVKMVAAVQPFVS